MSLHHLPCYLVLFVTRILMVSSNQTESLQETYSGVLANITRINSVLKDLLRNYDELKKIQGQKLSAESIEDPPSSNSAKGYESAPDSIHKKSDTVPTQMPFESREKTGNLDSIKEEAFKILDDNQGKKTAHDVVRSRLSDSSMEDTPINVKRTAHREKNKSSSKEEESAADSGSNEALRKRVTVGIMLRSRPEYKAKTSADEETLWYKILKKKLQQLAKIEQIVKEPETVNNTPLEPRIEGLLKLAIENSAIHDDTKEETHRALDTKQMDKTLRSEYGGVCLKVVIKKCYLALCGALDKFCSKTFNCKDNFKDNFKKCARKNCISYFEGNPNPPPIDNRSHLDETRYATEYYCDDDGCRPKTPVFRTNKFAADEKGYYNQPYEKVNVENEANTETAIDQRITTETQNMKLNFNEIKQHFYNETFDATSTQNVQIKRQLDKIEAVSHAQPFQQELAYKENINRKSLKPQFYSENFETDKTQGVRMKTQTDKIETQIPVQPFKQEPAHKVDKIESSLVQELDDLLNKVQIDANTSSLDNRVFKEIKTQAVDGPEHLINSQNADKEIEPRFVENVATSEKVPLYTEKTTPLDTPVETADDYIDSILRDSTLQKLEEECAEVTVSKCEEACTKAVMNNVRDAAQEKDFIKHCKPQCRAVFGGGGGGGSNSDNSSDSDSEGSEESDSDASSSDR